jgi:phage-related protein
MFSVAFFKTSAGNEPVLDWIRSLSRQDRAILGADLRTIQLGFPIGMPLCRPLKGGLFESRSSLSGKQEARLIFFQDGKLLIVVCGFIKKTRATPQSELEIARKRKAEYNKNRR